MKRVNACHLNVNIATFIRIMIHIELDFIHDHGRTDVVLLIYTFITGKFFSSASPQIF